MSEGMADLLGDALGPELLESLEEIVEAVVALCDCDESTTSQVTVSLDLIDADLRWDMARNLLHNNEIALPYRVADLLVLLYAQPMATLDGGRPAAVEVEQLIALSIGERCVPTRPICRIIAHSPI